MKRMMLVGLVIMLGVSLALTAQAQPTGSWSTPDDFATKFWKEKFFGGGPGQLGNTLMAIGQGFVFQNAVLASVVCGTPADWCDGAAFSCVTGYEGGMLTLNPSGPWKKNFKARGVTATNTSCHDGNGNLLDFSLAMAGQFDRSPYYFDIVATFDMADDNYEVKTDIDGVVFQRGYSFDAIITIY